MIPSRQKQRRHPSLALAAGLLALFLQVLAPVLPTAAMTGAMNLAAATPEEAASFAATCLGLGRPDLGDQAPADHQAKCPICLSVAQGQGFAPLQAPLVTAVAWASPEQPPVTDSALSIIAASAFASRAPPTA